MTSVRAHALGIVLVLGGVMAGCSGANNTEISDDPVSGTSANNPAPSSTSKSSPPPSDGTPSTPTPTTPTTPAPPTTPTDPTPPPDTKCTVEVEPNDSMAKATVFTSKVCGTIDSASDVDFTTFTVPAGTRSIAIKHDEKGGNVTYRVLVSGIPAPFVDGGDIELDVVPGATYAISARGPAGNVNAHPSYEIDVAFK